jgi:pyruvate dehydrogenase E1 component beta subunit
VPIGKANVLKEGRDVTIVAISAMVMVAIAGAAQLEKRDIRAEVIDLRTVKPLDEETILRSVKKTGRLLIADSGWKSFGVSAEIAAIVAEKALFSLKAPLLRVALPDSPAPASRPLEEAYYPTKDDVMKAVMRVMKG